MALDLIVPCASNKNTFQIKTQTLLSTNIYEACKNHREEWYRDPKFFRVTITFLSETNKKKRKGENASKNISPQGG